jgi:hypothetical protein
LNTCESCAWDTTCDELRLIDSAQHGKLWQQGWVDSDGDVRAAALKALGGMSTALSVQGHDISSVKSLRGPLPGCMRDAVDAGVAAAMSVKLRRDCACDTVARFLRFVPVFEL